MFEIRYNSSSYGLRMLVAFFAFMIITSIVSGVNAVLAAHFPGYPFDLGMVLSSLLGLLFLLFMTHSIFARTVIAIVMIDNMIYMERNFFSRVVVDLDYTQKVVFSRGLKKMSVTDASGKKKSFRISDLGAENVQRFINELSEVTDKYGFLLVDENGDMSWGSVKGHALSREEPELPVNSTDTDDSPYKVK